MFVSEAHNSSKTRLSLLSTSLGILFLTTGCGAQATAASSAFPNASSAGSSATTPAVKVTSNSKLGKILTTSSGMTLYRYKKDSKNKSVCTTRCAHIWPPLTWKGSGKPKKGQGVPGTLGLIKRPNGSKQVTYNGVPLYTYSRDSSPGNINGQGFKKLWYVATLTTKAGKSTSGTASGSSGKSGSW